MGKKKISIIMPVYNGQRFIHDSLESILNQTFSDFELIVIDDASSDNTFDIIKSYKDKRIRLSKNDFNIGQVKTLNKAIRLAEAEFIARLDQDDIAAKERLKTQINFLLRHNEISVLGTSAIIINERVERIDRWSAPDDKKQIRFEILFNNPVAHSSVILRKKALLDTGCYNEDFVFSQDYELWSRMLQSGFEIANIDEPLLFLRIHGNCSTRTMRLNRFYAEVPRIIKGNICSLTGVDISIEVAEKICKALNDPTLLSKEEFEYVAVTFDKISKKFKDACGKDSGKLNKAIAKFKYILALGYAEKENLPCARDYFIDSFRTYPYNLNPLGNYLLSLFGGRFLRFARSIKKSMAVTLQ